jgi:hypothetical protein
VEVDFLKIGMDLDGAIAVHEHTGHSGLFGFNSRLYEFGQVDARTDDTNNRAAVVDQTVDPDLRDLNFDIVVDIQLAFFRFLLVA